MKRLLPSILFSMSLTAAPRMVYGLALQGDALFATNPGAPDGSWQDPVVQMWMRTVVYREVELWSKAAPTLRAKDPDPAFDYASTIPRWERLANQLQLDHAPLVVLLWLECRWKDRHELYHGEDTPEFRRWERWTSELIRSLTHQVVEDQARTRRAEAAFKEAQSNPFVPKPKTEDLTYLQGLATQRQAEARVAAEAEARANDPTGGLASSVQQGVANYQLTLLKAMGIK